ncbi:PEP/pyruvate-binding domain-containing protein [Streptomyces rubradiris]|uniref:PEP/pyruvate-binding domain-containing protein n=1 Tax=Streptomyces rubradiris TaxID=285531 RepID=UPI003400CF00
MQELVFADTAEESADAHLVGHKFARQAQLRLAGYDVPEFVCVSAGAFDAVMASVQLPELTATDPQSLTDWAEQASSAVLKAGVPDELAKVLLYEFDQLADESGTVAVRSCAVPRPDEGEEGGEDSAADPFAGLGSSFLAVHRDELLGKVAECWASAFTPEGVLYRVTRGGDPAATRMAVGIQRLVAAERSFVAFSRDPRGDGADRSVIAAAYGLGEGVVQEQADVDHFLVDRTSGTVTAQAVHKARRVVPVAGGGTTVGEVPEELADRPVLDDETARRVARLAVALEEHFGLPQDIEGAITADGRLQLVQARPAVVTGPRRQLHWSNGNISESYAGFTSPLSYSMASELYAVGMEELYRRMGVPERELRRNRYELRRMIGYLDGRLYMRLESWYRLHSQMRAFQSLRRQWEKAVVTVDASVVVPEKGRVGRWLTKAREVPSAALRWSTHTTRMRRFSQWWQQRYEAMPDFSTRTPAQIVEDYRELWADVALRWGGTLVNNTYVIAELGLIERLLNRWAPKADRGAVNGLLCDGPVNRSVLALRSLIALAESVGRHPQAREAVLDDSENAAIEAWRRLSGGEFGPELAEQAQAHVRGFGHRTLHDLKLETVVVEQRPHLLISQLRPVIMAGRTVRSSIEDERRARREAERELRAQCRNPLHRAVIRLVFRSLRRHMQIREDTRFDRTELVGVTRRMVCALADHLVAAGTLDSPEDVFELTMDELMGTYEGASVAVAPRDIVRLRREQRAAAVKRSDPPGVFATDADVPVAAAVAAVRPTATGGATTLTGLASSGGVVRGRARVITDPDVDPESCRGRILVTRETDPGWLFLMLVAKGLVAERGTVLSHTAITGRIFGVPTVVAVRGAVDRIADGALIEVDGDRGTVTVLDEAQDTESVEGEAEAAA